MIDETVIQIWFWFKIIYFVCSQTYDFGRLRFYRSQKVSDFQIKFFISQFGWSQIMLYHTTSNPNLLMWSDFLEFACYFIFRFLSYRTCIKNHNISLRDVLYKFPTTICQNRFYPSTIGIIHLTTKDQYMEFFQNLKLKI
jgi:hypothetical protein